MRGWLVASLACVACGCSHPRGGPPENRLVHPPNEGVVVSDATWRDCPAGFAEEAARAAPHEAFEEVRTSRCLPGRFGDATLVAFVSVGPPRDSKAETGTIERAVTMRADGSDYVVVGLGGEDWMGSAPVPRLIVDLDGDGTDEIVMTHVMNPTTQAVYVLHSESNALELITIPRDYGEGAPKGVQPDSICNLAVSIGDPRKDGGHLLVIDASATRFAPEEGVQCHEGRWVYMVQGDRVASMSRPPE